MRRILTILMIISGFAIQIISYFLFAAPWHVHTGPVVSTETMFPFAPLIFIIGVMLVFLSAVVYELLPDNYEWLIDAIRASNVNSSSPPPKL